MRVLACKREDCPLERTREAMNAFRAKRIAEGIAPTHSKNDYTMTCPNCSMTRGWVHHEDGSEREIPQSVIWGNPDLEMR